MKKLDVLLHDMNSQTSLLQRIRLQLKLNKKSPVKSAKRPIKEILNSTESSHKKSHRPNSNSSMLISENFNDLPKKSKNSRNESFRKSHDFRMTLNSSALHYIAPEDSPSPLKQPLDIHNQDTAKENTISGIIEEEDVHGNMLDVPKNYIDTAKQLLESDELHSSPIQAEVIKKILDEFKVIGEVLAECNYEVIRKTRTFHEELDKLRKDNKELKDDLQKLKGSNEEMEVLMQHKDDEIAFLKEQLTSKNQQTITEEDSFLKSHTASIYDSKKKSGPRFLKSKNSSMLKEKSLNLLNEFNHAHHPSSSEDSHTLRQRLQSLMNENHTLREENKTLWLQNKKALELAVGSKNAKILKYNEQIQKSPLKSPMKSPMNTKKRSPSPKNSNPGRMMNGKQNKSKENLTAARETYSGGKEHGSGFGSAAYGSNGFSLNLSTVGVGGNGHSSKIYSGQTQIVTPQVHQSGQLQFYSANLQSGKKVRPLSVDKSHIERSKSMENMGIAGGMRKRIPITMKA